eukprot:snap_masked-scaffold_1-processed-gene-5.35-mRNA-1 protein AED:1.00 eAED:1.00 QI:0/0/0/0/1/1/2/0/66
MRRYIHEFKRKRNISDNNLDKKTGKLIDIDLITLQQLMRLTMVGCGGIFNWDSESSIQQKYDTGEV